MLFELLSLKLSISKIEKTGPGNIPKWRQQRKAIIVWTSVGPLTNQSRKGLERLKNEVLMIF